MLAPSLRRKDSVTGVTSGQAPLLGTEGVVHRRDSHRPGYEKTGPKASGWPERCPAPLRAVPAVSAGLLASEVQTAARHS
jgi:hypothetical protein